MAFQVVPLDERAQAQDTARTPPSGSYSSALTAEPVSGRFPSRNRIRKPGSSTLVTAMVMADGVVNAAVLPSGGILAVADGYGH